ncbi:sodium:proton antiporter [Bacillus sp. ISL-18]|uniref:Na+/H+ antiporter NhaC family protein n=1 Tax=Bacillus sp. ISL-18 TaxID=2819118 RepID=UPI001BECAC7F|nr:Na+/H+ antiporter NhaC family protein [Bacillus sp. ISL-18]MBT2656134.1 sodium:proton antiporter [Bacillus sp. ISL-18]
MMVKFSFMQVLFLLLTTIVGVIWSVIYHQPLVIGFLPGYLVLFFLSLKNKFPIRKSIKISLLGVHKTRIVIIILLLVSFLLPSWYLSGTIEQMVHMALNLIHPHHFFILSFVISMIFSMLLGTTIGTLSAIGVPILGTAAVLHLPLPIVAGALVSGAFVGDRTSPYSSAHQLLSHTVEVPVKRQQKAMFITTIAAILVCLCFYGVVDISFASKASLPSSHLVWSKLSLAKFFPPIILIVFVLFRLSIIYAFLSSILSAVVISFVNGASWTQLTGALWHGIDGLGGGFVHMYQLLLFLALAGAYNGLLEEMNVLQPYLDKWLESSHNLLIDTLKTIFATLIITLIAANQTLPIILTGRSFLPHWSHYYGKEELARVMGDSTMLFPGIVPWSVLTIMCSTIVGIPLLEYLPFALFLWLLPIVTILISFGREWRKSKKHHTATA